MINQGDVGGGRVVLLFVHWFLYFFWKKKSFQVRPMLYVHVWGIETPDEFWWPRSIFFTHLAAKSKYFENVFLLTWLFDKFLFLKFPATYPQEIETGGMWNTCYHVEALIIVSRNTNRWICIFLSFGTRLCTVWWHVFYFEERRMEGRGDTRMESPVVYRQSARAASLLHLFPASCLLSVWETCKCTRAFFAEPCRGPKTITMLISGTIPLF